MKETVSLKLHNPKGVREILDRLNGMPEDNQSIADLLFVATAAAYIGDFDEVSIFSLVSQQLEMIRDEYDD